MSKLALLVADAGPAPVRRTPRRAWSTTVVPAQRWSQLAAVASLGVLCLALILLTRHAWGDIGGDTGYDQLAAARTAHGELPYADYVYFYGPLVPMLLGGIYAVTGVGLAPAIVLGLAVTLVAIGLTYRLARHLAGPWGAAAAAGLVATVAFAANDNAWPLAHALSAPLSITLLLAALLALHPALETGRRRWFALAGAAVGVAALARLDVAVVAGAAIAVWLALRIWRGADRRAALAQAGALAGPAVGIALVGYGAFLTQVSLHDLLLQNLWPQDILREATNAALAAAAPLDAHSFLVLGARTVGYAAGAAALVGLATLAARSPRARRLALGAAAVAGAGLVLVAVARPESVGFHLRDVYGFVPLGAWIATLVVGRRVLRAEGGGTPSLQLLLLGCLLLAALASPVYGAFMPYLDGLHPGNAPYYWPLVALFLLWLHVRVLPMRAPAARTLGVAWLVVLTLVGAAVVIDRADTKSVVVSGPGGRIDVTPADGPAYQGALDALARYSKPGDPVLLAPQMGSLYVIADRRNPLPELALLPGALATPADEQRAIDRMRDVRVAVIDRTPLGIYHRGAFGQDFNTGIGRWLQSRFRLTTTLQGAGSDPRKLDIWTRRSP